MGFHNILRVICGAVSRRRSVSVVRMRDLAEKGDSIDGSIGTTAPGERRGSKAETTVRENLFTYVQKS